MLITIAIGLYASRVVLQTLGESDFGIYSIVGSVVLMLNFINVGMMQASQRFISFAIGLNDKEKLKKAFGSSFFTHLAIAGISVVLAETVGLMIFHTLNIPAERMQAAFWVYQCSVLSFVCSIISVPYNSTIIAHEQMDFYAYICILEAALKLVVIYFLIIAPFDKLIFYALLILGIQILIPCLYAFYCHIKFEECDWHPSFSKDTMYSMFTFAGWSIVGNMGFAFRDQGTNIILNYFFGTLINAARGIATQVSAIINGFATNITLALNPPIVKSYASGDIQRSRNLVYLGCRAAFSLLSIITIPLLINVQFVLDVWLVKVPENTSLFIYFILCNSLIYSLSQPITVAIQATGQIKWFQIIICALLCIELGSVALVLYFTHNLLWSLFPSVIISFIAIISRFAILKHLVPSYSWHTYLFSVVGRCICVYLLCFGLCYIIHTFCSESGWGPFVIETCIYLCLTAVGVLFGVLSAQERQVILSKLIHKIIPS